MNLAPPSTEETCRPTNALIDLDALSYNYRQISREVSEGIKIYAIIKANAYGHGVVPVSRELDTLGAEGFGVATVEEGMELRKAGIRKPILIMGASLKGIRNVVKYGLTPVIYSAGSAEKVAEEARIKGTPVGVHVKVDTGMGRLGILPSEWPGFLKGLVDNPWLRVEGILSHFSSAEKDPDFTALQLKRYDKSITQAIRVGISCAEYHIANSAGILSCLNTSYPIVRPGILLYGCYPDPALRSRIELRPVMTLRTEILYLKSVPKDTPISYGQTFRTRKRSVIATLPIGYADGYRRDLSNKGWVLIRGEKAPVVGNITMDLTMVDVTHIPGVKEGDEVILFSASQLGGLRVEELASLIGTISYELLCGISSRVPRVYVKGGRACTVKGT